MHYEIFKFESDENPFNEIRTIEIDGRILFCASDVAKALGYKNPNEAVATHCKPANIENHYVAHPNGIGGVFMKFIPEGQIYRLTIKSELPSAEKFADWIFDEVIPSIRERGYYGKIDRLELPNFIKRYQDNFHKIDRGYFSVISELFVTLGQELSKYGYDIPDKGIDGKGFYPDISVGKMFSDYLKKIEHPLRNSYKKYKHSFVDERIDVDAKMYPLDLLPEFRRFVFNIWLPKRGPIYFREKDPVALDYLPKLLEKPSDNDIQENVSDVIDKELKVITKHNPKTKRDN
ncbi:hypothetical protein D0T53_01395 [Dysgonomonas sp. 216]|uniref:BRO-N domain-containing protein n=1 Tax=Dysgonomonas sp. 216 TaxID=2302934 RepID=UPI0013CFC220|nr:BRO family protein [Dysgonomonas sp. 216]NDW17569.1 hypothetical protein [Dysgonomonas sp. 216]